MVKKRDRANLKLLSLALLAVFLIVALSIITSTESPTGLSGGFVRKTPANEVYQFVSEKCEAYCYPHEPIRYVGGHGNIASCLCKEG